jgi:L-fuculose-phosphate aldolase
MERERAEVAEYGRRMEASGLTRGTGGNLSVFDPESGLFAVKPGGLPYGAIAPEDVPLLDLSGQVVEGDRAPSSEWRMHAALYVPGGTIRAAVHTHSVFATTLACLGWEVPPLHYLLAYAGPRLRICPYRPFGSAELARAAAETMGGDRAILLANHGLLAVGSSLPEAFAVAEETEFVCELYCRAKALGEPRLLSPEETDDALDRIGAYARRSAGLTRGIPGVSGR